MTVHERPFGRCLEDFVVGDVYRHWPGKTITEYDDHLFCMITMNHHPLHTNDWFAAQSVQGRNVVVGNLVYSVVLGMSVPDVSGSAIANLEVETLQHKFADVPRRHHPRRDRACSTSRSRRRSPDRGVVTVESKGFNQDGEEVCYFRRRVMVWKRDAAPGRTPPLRRRRGVGVDRPTAVIDHRRRPRLGRAAAARPAVAANPRPVAGARGGGDAAADAGGARRAEVGGLPVGVPVARRMRPRPAR